MDRITRAGPLLALIRRHESDGAAKGQGVASAYDVVWSGIKPEDRPRKLSALPVDRVLWWQDLIDARYMSEAAGAYQIMEDTLRTLAVDRSAIFDAATQDALGLQLLDRRGWAKCEAGQMTPEAFANELAKEWASLPVVTAVKRGARTLRPGQSYYAGDGLNAAHAKPAEVLAAIRAALAGDAAAPVPAAPEPAPGAAEDAVVAWLARMPPEARAVGRWLAEAQEIGA
ncbi:MAG: hypothetical protein KA745_00130 [Gemmatimonadales bacterium]|nr:hypothetical protein [Gemmatimonadales bacterium]